MPVPQPFVNPSPDEISQTLRDSRVIAVVGLSDNPARPSNRVARYLQQQGYQIVPVTPGASEILGEQAYPDLLSIPFDVDIVDIFRRSEYVAAHVDEAISKGAQAVWMQLGVRDEQAAQRAQEAGLRVVMDRCIAVEHERLVGSA